MTIWEGIIIFGVFGVIVWWAHTAVFDACEDCNYDCRQGRDCPKKGDINVRGNE